MTDCLQKNKGIDLILYIFGDSKYLGSVLTFGSCPGRRQSDKALGRCRCPGVQHFYRNIGKLSLNLLPGTIGNIIDCAELG
jgi:hypothetical protein